jgi:hypothetical protein
MKKVLIFLILFLYGMVSVIEGKSQTGRPCATYDQSRDISGMKEILMDDETYASNLRIAYAICINRGIGKIIVNGSIEDIEYVLENTVLLDVNFVNISDYENGIRFGDEIKFTNLVGQPSDKWAAFRYNGIDYIYAKVACMNPQRPRVRGVFIEKKKEIPVDTWTYKEPKKATTPDVYIPPAPKEEKEIRIGWIVIPIVAIVAGGVTYWLLNRDSSHRNPGGTPVRPDPPVEDPGGPGGTPIPGG